MKTMLSKFKSKCAGCSGTINKGTEIKYDPQERKAYHAGCQPEDTGERQYYDYIEEQLIENYYRR